MLFQYHVYVDIIIAGIASDSSILSFNYSKKESTAKLKYPSIFFNRNRTMKMSRHNETSFSYSAILSARHNIINNKGKSESFHLIFSYFLTLVVSMPPSKDIRCHSRVCVCDDDYQEGKSALLADDSCYNNNKKTQSIYDNHYYIV